MTAEAGLWRGHRLLRRQGNSGNGRILVPQRGRSRMSTLRELWQRSRLRILSGLALPGCLCLAGAALGDNVPAPAGPALSVVQQQPLLDLAACRRLALAQQPALTAAQDALAMAEARSRAVDRLLIAGLIEREIPIRRQQAALGVRIAEAGVNLAQSETVYAVTRNYLSVLYAQQQLDVVDGALKR